MIKILSFTSLSFSLYILLSFFIGILFGLSLIISKYEMKATTILDYMLEKYIISPEEYKKYKEEYIYKGDIIKNFIRKRRTNKKVLKHE